MNKKFLTKIAEENSAFVTSSTIPIPTTTRILFNKLLCKKNPAKDNVVILIDKNKTDACARNIISSGMSKHIAILNFASFRTPCGGYDKGSKAQEEDVCRAAPLLAFSLKAKEKEYYPLKSCCTLITPDVLIVRNTNNYELLDEKEFFKVTVVSAAAQDLNDEEFNYQTTYNTIVNIFCSVKIAYPIIDTLVLGALGCGVFKNDPYVIAGIMNEVTKHYGGYYKNIIYAIPKGPNLKEFIKTIIRPNDEDDEEENSSSEELESKTKEGYFEKPPVHIVNRKGNRKQVNAGKYVVKDD